MTSSNSKYKNHKLAIRVCLIILAIYSFLFIGTAIIANIILFNINSFKDKIQNYVSNNTGYNLIIDSFDSRFTNDYIPELIINGITISRKDTPNTKLHFKQITVNLSYNSLWKFDIIFNKIVINDTELDIVYEKNGNVLLNGILISSSTKLKNTTNKKSFDAENWLLLQREISLNHVNISLLHNKNNLKKIKLNNINVVYLNQFFDAKHLRININENSQKNHLFADLKWNGNKFEDYSNWNWANFTLKTYSDNAIFSKHIQKYIPSLGFINQYRAKTAIDIAMKNGYLTTLNANVNVNNLAYTLANILTQVDTSKSPLMQHNKTNIINFPNISGQLHILLNQKTSTYLINAENLAITTSHGSLIGNKHISGSYTINKGGSLIIKDSNLSGINNLLTFIPIAKGIKIGGKINQMELIWNGNIFNPNNYLFKAKFESIALNTDGKLIPKISNISGEINVGKNKGTAHILIESNTFIYKKLFYVPFQINRLNTNLNWQIHNESFTVYLESTIINASDFNIRTHGKYIYVPKSAGYLALYAYLDKIPAKRVGYYLPTSIDSVNKWLQTAIGGGYGENATLTLEGWLNDFPFESGDGKFYIDANISNGQLRYVKGWPTIDNVYGKFMIRNQKIIITASDAKVSNNKIIQANVVIPNMLLPNSYLIADGVAVGSTSNFINYLRRTPINQILGHLPDKLNTKGNGKVKIHLNVPFASPEKTTVLGRYNFNNNSITFDLPIPQIYNTQGNLDFTNNSVNIKSITANTLGGTLKLDATTDTHTGLMYFNAQTKNIDYQQLANTYLPVIKPIIGGNANTNIFFILNNNGITSLNASSNLDNVTINAPVPLQKSSKKSAKLHFTMNKALESLAYDINFTYGNALFGNLILGQNGSLTSGKFQLGNTLQDGDNLPATVRINASPNKFDLISWISTFNQLLAGQNVQHYATKINSKQNKLLNLKNQNTKAYASPTTNISLHTPNFYIDNIPFGYAHAQAYINHDTVAFNIAAYSLDGYGVYEIPNNQLVLNIYFANITKSLENSNEIKSEQILGYNTESSNNSEPITESYINNLLDTMQTQANTYAKLITATIKLPNTQLHVKQLYYKGSNIGRLNLSIKSESNNLVIENGTWYGDYATHNFNLTNYCFSCNKSHALVNLNFNSHFNDLGKSLSKLKLEGILAQTSGNVSGQLQWLGMIDEFNLRSLVGKINIKLKNGRFLKVDTGNTLGSIIGIINLQTLVNLVSLNFREIFANGFAFNQLDADAYISNDILYLKYFYMASTLAVVGLKGKVDLLHDSVNMYLNVTPSLGMGVAVGAGLVTLNPLIGVATYLAELALQNPINKLFAFTFHLTGSLKQPKIEQIGVSKQISKNITSTVGE